MSFVGDKKRVESMLKDNATAFSDAGNMLFEPKYEELMAKSLSSKNKSKELFVSIKSQWSTKEGSKRQPFRRGPLFRSRGNRVRGIFEPAGNTLQEDKEGLRMNFLTAPFISSTNLLSPWVFCKVRPLVANFFPVKIKQLPRATEWNILQRISKDWQTILCYWIL